MLICQIFYTTNVFARFVKKKKVFGRAYVTLPCSGIWILSIENFLKFSPFSISTVKLQQPFFIII